jgi:hypothetical protein
VAIVAKTCSRCGIEQSINEFVWRRSRGAWGSHCRACRAEYGRAHYEKNRDLYKERAIAQKRRLLQERTEFLFEYFRVNPCRDCGESDPVVLEFDHLRDKHFNIGGHLPFYKWERILEEIAKCDVVCANCHRRRTAARQGSIRAVMSGLRADDLASIRGRGPAGR